MTLRLFWRGAFVLLFALVTWLTLTPNPEETKPSLAIARFIAEILFHDERFSDKVAHFLAYAALGGSAVFAGLTLGGRRLFVIAALALYGASLEFLQGVGGVRAAEFGDAVANALGAVFAFPAALALERLAAKSAAS
ncbi:MAG TPA: VanZ family protein [Parvularculaceae bacterium]|nr:VanZ family protein [Parvularculaceae bacterium]